MRYPCPCCGYLTLSEPPGSYGICPVCFWEDDPVQLRYPEAPVGANGGLSLIDAQRNFARFGAMDEQFKQNVRPPAKDEPIDETWRPFDPERDGVRGSSEPSSGLEYFYAISPERKIEHPAVAHLVEQARQDLFGAAS